MRTAKPLRGTANTVGGLQRTANPSSQHLQSWPDFTQLQCSATLHPMLSPSPALGALVGPMCPACQPGARDAGWRAQVGNLFSFRWGEGLNGPDTKTLLVEFKGLHLSALDKQRTVGKLSVSTSHLRHQMHSMPKPQTLNQAGGPDLQPAETGLQSLGRWATFLQSLTPETWSACLN